MHAMKNQWGRLKGEMKRSAEALSKSIAGLDHMKIRSMGILSIDTGIGHVMEPITHAKSSIDFRSDRHICNQLEQASHVLVCEMLLAENRASPSDFQ